MKNISFLMFPVLLSFCAQTITAQQLCTNPSAQIDIHGNNIRARLLMGGDLFWDLNSGQFVANEVAGQPPKPSSIFSAALWIGGVAPQNNLAMAGVQYRVDGNTDYWAGPLTESGLTDHFSCANWDRFFRVTGGEIARFLDTLPALNGNSSLAIAQFRDVMGWPAKGNPYFVDIWGFDLPFTTQTFAPFYDHDGNGLYDPLQGDHPMVELQNGVNFVPAEIIWCVFNDNGAGSPHAATAGAYVHIEVQLTTWAFNCPDQPVLNNTVFTAHKIIHRSNATIDSCYVGLFVDFDLGCYSDDRVGCAPGLSSFYAYNADAVDGSSVCTTNGGPTFGNKPPVQSVSFLNKSLDKFLSFGNAVSGTPNSATNSPGLGNTGQYYGALTGSWLDFKRLTYGGTGYKASGGTPTDYAFPGNPGIASEWSMCSANIAGADRRVIGSHKIGKFLPGQVEELVTAWTYHPMETYIPCNVDTALAEIASLHTQYDQGFAQVCAPVVSTKYLDKLLNVTVFPNPATNQMTVQYGDLQVRAIECYNALGMLVRTIENPTGQQCVFDVSGLANGVYMLNIQLEKGNTIVKINVLNH